MCLSITAFTTIGAIAISADAQGLRALHVDALTMRASRTHVAVGEDFTLTIHVRVRERIAALDELVIPDVGTMHVLGDERRAASGGGGTDVDEVLTLEPAEAGTFTLPGASLDAIDARTGKPTRFTANSVRITVGAPGGSFPLRFIAAIVLGIALAAMAALAAWRALATRRAPRAAPIAASPPPAVQPMPTPRDDVRLALHAFRSSPGPATLGPLRAALFRAAGVGSGATQRDAANATNDAALLTAVRAADGAAFATGPLRDDPAALIAAVEVWLT